MRSEGKIATYQIWRLTSYSLIILIIVVTNSLPLSVVTASSALTGSRTANTSQVIQPVRQGSTSKPTPAPTTTDRKSKSTPAPATNKPDVAPKPRYSGLGTPVTFTNTSSLTINDNTSATPYPSTITVTGVSSNVLAATVTLTGLTHQYSDDIDMLLVGPTGQKTFLMSDVGTNSISNLTLVFDDSASNSLSTNSSITSGTYKPTNNDNIDTCGSSNDNFASPAPSGPYSASLSVFNEVNPNGAWQLFVRDDCSLGSGSLSGWSITLYAYQQPVIFTYTGSGQSTTVDTSFANPLQAIVKDGNGDPLANTNVTFTTPGTGASGTFAGGSHTYTGTTDSNGIITATTLTANTIAGSYSVTATTGVSSLVANFSLTNTAGDPATISANSGTNQHTNINTGFSVPLVATVYDINNNAVSSQVITFTAPGSGASGTFANNSNVYVGTTDASGRITTTTFTANSITGTYIVTATAFSATSGPLQTSFTLTNDPASTVQFQNSSYSVNEGAGTAVVTLTRGVNSSAAITATVLINNITTSAIDYNLGNNISAGLDGTFDTTIGANGNINDIVVQPDGKILIAGDFTTYNSTARNHIVRLNADGSLDTSFDSSIGANNGVGRIALQPDGKILIGGSFTTYNNIARNRVARLNADGSLDTTFDSSIGANSDVTVVALQPDGKVLIGGNFTTYNSTTRNWVARLNSDGTLDTSFDSSTGPNNIVWDLVVQPADSKVIIVGRFTTYNGTSRNRVARLNTDGSLDTSFDPGTGTNNNLDIWRTTLQPDGKVLIGGDFTTFNGVTRIRIARLNSDGSLDTSFNSGASSANNGVRPMVVQPDGKILTSGDFTTFNGVSRNHFTRLNSDGTLDTSFDIGTGANDFVGAIALQTDGKILIGGRFTSYNGTSANRLARLGNTTQVSWSAGDNAPKTITMNIVDDNLIEGNEQLAMTVNSTTSGAILGSPVSTTLTIVDNDFSIIAALSGSGQSTTINTAFSQPLIAQVNGVSSAVVTFTAPASGASGTFAGGSTVYTGTTDSNGLITTTLFTANSVSGSFNVTATAPVVSNTISYSLTNLSGPPAQVNIVSGSGQSVVVSNTFSLPLVVKVVDSAANPVGSTIVTFTAPASGASGTFAGGSTVYTGTTDSNGLITTTLFTANATVGTYTVSATASGVASSASFSLTNLTGCNPLLVTSSLDDGSCGTLRNALSVAGSGSSKTVTITLAAGSVITLTSGLTLGSGVAITTTATCASTGPVITIRGSGNSSGDGVTLSSGNSLYDVWVRGFSGRQIIAPNGGGNSLRCVKASKS